MKSAEEIMAMLDAYDLTGSLRDAGEPAGCPHHTVKRHVELRAAGGELGKAAARPQLIDEFSPKVEGWVSRSHGKVRADVRTGQHRLLGRGDRLRLLQQVAGTTGFTRLRHPQRSEPVAP